MQVTQRRARDSHKSLMLLWHPSSRLFGIHHLLQPEGQRLLSPSLPYVCRQTDTHRGSVTAPHASEEAESSSGSRSQQSGQRSEASPKAQRYSGCIGPQQQPRGSCAIRAKVKQRFRCRSSTLPLLAYSEDLPRCR